MVLRLADALEVPLRDRNGLLLAAGFAPLYPHRELDDPSLTRVTLALNRMLDQHEPFPAVVMDRGWNLLRANDGAQRLFGLMWAPRSGPRRRQRAAPDPRTRAGPLAHRELGGDGARVAGTGAPKRSAGCSTTRPPSSSRSYGPARTSRRWSWRRGRSGRPARSSTCTSDSTGRTSRFFGRCPPSELPSTSPHKSSGSKPSSRPTTRRRDRWLAIGAV